MNTATKPYEPKVRQRWQETTLLWCTQCEQYISNEHAHGCELPRDVTEWRENQHMLKRAMMRLARQQQ